MVLHGCSFKMSSGSGGASVDPTRFTLFSKPAIKTPNIFTGETDWEEFSFQFKAYIEVLSPGVSDYLTQAETNVGPITGFHPTGSFTSEMLTQLSREIRLLLSQMLSGEALLLIRQQTISTNGFELWRLLNSRFQLPKRVRAMGHFNSIYAFTFNDPSFQKDLTAWETSVSDYQRHSGSLIPDDMKISLLTGKLPSHLQDHVTLNTADSSSYNDIKEVLVNYFKSKKAFMPPSYLNPESSNPSNGPAPMQIGQVTHKGSGKGDQSGKGGRGRGRGKGRGRGRFNKYWKPYSYHGSKGKGKRFKRQRKRKRIQFRLQLWLWFKRRFKGFRQV